MTDAERMLLSDAIETAIEAEKKVIRVKRLCYILTAALIGLLTWVVIGG